jgi:hypothetical protein
MSNRDREIRIRERLAAAPAMTASQRRDQRISFAYGNVAIDDPSVTRAMVETIARKK